MVYLIAVLTFVLVVDCLVLILLVLMQLPKKEAGAGLAFGGAATDALFGAGSGNFLTKATKYAAVIMFVLAVALSLMQTRVYHGPRSNFRENVQNAPQQNLPATAPAHGSPSSPNAPTGPAVTTSPNATAPATNMLLEIPPASTNSSGGAAPK
jgi:preprotein translocase subunit SecG